MTTVVALAADGVVHMAGDSRTNVYDRPVDTARKIVRVEVGGDTMLLGVAGDGALSGLLRYDLDWPELQAAAPADRSGGEAEQAFLHQLAWMVTDLCLTRQVGLTDGTVSSSVLVGWRGRLHNLTHAQAITLDTEVGAIGRGEEPAMATMLALRHYTKLGPELVLRAAVGLVARLAPPTTGGAVDYQTTRQG